MPSIWGYDINCVTSLPTSPQVCLFSSAGSHGNMVRNHKWTSSGQNWGIPGESKMPGLEDPESGASPTGQMAAATQAGLGGLLPFCLQSFFFYKQYIQLWCDDFKGSRRLCATGRLLGSCMVRSLPRSHHYLLKEVRSTLSPPSDALAARL